MLSVSGEKPSLAKGTGITGPEIGNETLATLKEVTVYAVANPDQARDYPAIRKNGLAKCYGAIFQASAVLKVSSSSGGYYWQSGNTQAITAISCRGTAAAAQFPECGRRRSVAPHMGA